MSEAMRYGVLGPAQRVSPIIAVRLARVFGTPAELTLPIATSVELLHCASLMIDDLPCMNDSCLRRNQPATHVKFGEATAVLTSFGLVALAARTVKVSARPLEQRTLGIRAIGAVPICLDMDALGSAIARSSRR